MNIVFYAASSGLGNNGGSRTILKSAQTLRDMGHTVDIVAGVDRFTYFDHPPAVGHIPAHTDVVIAVSWMDVESMHKDWPGPCAWWLRNWDTHRLTEPEICRLAAVQPTCVNGEFIQRRFRRAGIESEVVYQGIDFDMWIATDRPRGRMVGTIQRGEQRYRYCDFERLAVISKGCFGFDSVAKSDNMAEWYQSIDFYFAPQILGGLSNPPMEAAMCGALIVCPGIEESGLDDYANSETAIIYDNLEDVPELLKAADFGKVAKMQEVLKNKIGDRKKNMQKLIDFLGKNTYN